MSQQAVTDGGLRIENDSLPCVPQRREGQCGIGVAHLRIAREQLRQRILVRGQLERFAQRGLGLPEILVIDRGTAREDPRSIGRRSLWSLGSKRLLHEVHVGVILAVLLKCLIRAVGTRQNSPERLQAGE